MRKVRRGANRRPQEVDGKLKKYLPLLGLVALAVVIAIIMLPKPDSPEPDPDNTGWPTKAENVAEAVIYLDNSASMEGYTHGSEYIDALADLMSIYPKTKVRSADDSIEIDAAGELVDNLTGNKIHYKGQSLLNQDLKKIVGQVAGPKNKKIAFFVTDGIMSGADAGINRSKALGHKYNIDHKQSFKTDISEVFRGKGIGAAVYRMESQFNGVYYCYDNSNKPINARRSYYVIALGCPGVVADFKQRLAKHQQQPIFKFRPVNELDFIEKAPMSQSMTITGGTANRGAVSLPVESGSVFVDVQKVKKAASASEPVLNLMIGEDAFRNYHIDARELASRLKVSIDGTDNPSIKAAVDSTRKSIVLQISLSTLSFPSGGNKVRVYIPYFTPSWINLITNEDDGYMITGIPDNSTFLFAYFINGIKNNGILEENGFCIYDKTITLKRK